MTSRKPQSGSGMIELLMGIAIAIPLIIAGLNSLKSAVHSYSALIKAANTMQAFGKLNAHLSSIANENDQHIFKLSPIIHRNGLIKLGSGELNPVSRRTDALRPSLLSDAITHLDFHSKNIFKIKQVQQSGNSLRIFCCPKYDPSTTDIPLDIGTYLIFTTDRFSEFVGTRTPWLSASRKCFTVTGNVTGGMISGNRPLDEPYFAVGLIPIKKIYTLYIDSLGRLRFLGHRGPLNTENQPLADGPISVRYSTKNWPSSTHSQLAATFWPSSNKEFQKTYLSRMPRYSPTLLALNDL